MLVAIAWRNLWRNPRRTIITLLAVAGGLASMLAMYAMMRGMGDRILEGLTGSYIGHIQIHREGYRSRGGATRTVDDADLVLAATRGTEGVTGAAGRIYGFCHASVVRGEDEAVRAGGGEELASPVMALVGLEPDHEGEVTDIPTKVSEGRWFDGEAEVIVGQGLAKRHAIEVGDALLPTAVDMTGAMRGPWAVSAEVPRVVGIMRSGIEQYDARVAFMPRAYLAKLLRMEDEVHEIAIRGEDPEKLEELTVAIKASVAEARSRDAEVVVRASIPLELRREEAIGSEAADAPIADGGAPAADGGSPVADGGDGREPVTVRLVGVEPQDADGEGAPGGRAGRYVSRSEDLVLSRQVARDLGVGVDDRVVVAVPVDCGEGVPAEECPPSAEPFVVARVVEDPGLLGGRFGLIGAQVLTGNIRALSPGSVVDLDGGDRRAVAALTARLHGEVEAPDEILPWMELEPTLHQMMAMFDIAPLIFFIIIFFAVMLGIVNTMLMATFERTRELGLMRALGMRPSKVVAMVMWESVLLALVGIALGLALGMPLVWYWEANGMNMGVFMTQEQSFDFEGITIDPMLWPSVGLGDVLGAVVTVAVMTSASGLWPAIRAARLQPTEALRHE